jgi:hypothetical protein
MPEPAFGDAQTCYCFAMTQLEQACLPYLTTPLEDTNFGDAFKGFLQFRQEHPQEWAKADDIMVSIEFEFTEPERVGGLLGMFGVTKQGQPQAVFVLLERVLDSVSNEPEEANLDAPDRSAVVSLELEYGAEVLEGLPLDENFYDSSEYETLEEFVKTTLEDRLLQNVALLRPKRVELSSEDE